MNNSYHFNPTMQFYVLPQCLLLWDSSFHGRDQQWSRAPSQYPKRRLFVRSRKVSKPRDWYFELSYRFEIWQAHRQHCCRSACQISERLDNSKYKSRGFETLRDLTKRRLFGYWDGALHSFNAKVSKTLSDANNFNLGIDNISVPMSHVNLTFVVLVFMLLRVTISDFPWKLGQHHVWSWPGSFRFHVKNRYDTDYVESVIACFLHQQLFIVWTLHCITYRVCEEFRLLNTEWVRQMQYNIAMSGGKYLTNSNGCFKYDLMPYPFWNYIINILQ